MAFLTGKQIADELQRPATTIRTWGQIYKDFTPHKVENGRTYYLPESIEVFKKIQTLYEQGLLQAQIKEQLVRDFPINQEADIEGEGTSLVVRKEYQDMIGYFQAKIQRDDELIDLQRQEIAELKEQTRILKEALGLNQQKPTTTITRKRTSGKLNKLESKKRIIRHDKKSKKTTQNIQPKKKSSGKKKSWLNRLIGR